MPFTMTRRALAGCRACTLVRLEPCSYYRANRGVRYGAETLCDTCIAGRGPVHALVAGRASLLPSHVAKGKQSYSRENGVQNLGWGQGSFTNVKEACGGCECGHSITPDLQQNSQCVNGQNCRARTVRECTSMSGFESTRSGSSQTAGASLLGHSRPPVKLL